MQRIWLFFTASLLGPPALGHASPQAPPPASAPASEAAPSQTTEAEPAAAATDLALPSPAPAVIAAQSVPTTDGGRQGRHSIEISYVGHNFTHPGAQLGYSFRAVESSSRRHALVVGADVGGYAWLRHDFGAFVLPRIGWRGRHRVGLQGEANFHLGYLQSVLASPAFAVENGQVVESSRAGIANLLFGLTVGVGWFLPKAGVTPFARVGAVWHTPVFDALIVRFVLSAGVEVRL